MKLKLTENESAIYSQNFFEGDTIYYLNQKANLSGKAVIHGINIDMMYECIDDKGKELLIEPRFVVSERVFLTHINIYRNKPKGVYFIIRKILSYLIPISILFFVEFMEYSRIPASWIVLLIIIAYIKKMTFKSKYRMLAAYLAAFIFALFVYKLIISILIASIGAEITMMIIWIPIYILTGYYIEPENKKNNIKILFVILCTILVSSIIANINSLYICIPYIVGIVSSAITCGLLYVVKQKETANKPNTQTNNIHR